MLIIIIKQVNECLYPDIYIVLMRNFVDVVEESERQQLNMRNSRSLVLKSVEILCSLLTAGNKCGSRTQACNCLLVLVEEDLNNRSCGDCHLGFINELL